MSYHHFPFSYTTIFYTCFFFLTVSELCLEHYCNNGHLGDILSKVRVELMGLRVKTESRAAGKCEIFSKCIMIRVFFQGETDKRKRLAYFLCVLVRNNLQGMQRNTHYEVQTVSLAFAAAEYDTFLTITE